MHRPVLVTPPATLPVTLAEAKAQLRRNGEDDEGNLLAVEDDDLITRLIEAATEHLDGWTGILGRCLVSQQWRQDFDAFARCLALPLGPVISVDSVTWRDSTGAESTVSATDYAVVTDAGGRTVVRFRDSFALPSDLDEFAPVSVTFTAGHATVPKPIRHAILMLVGAWYENREETAIGVNVAGMPESVAIDALLGPYRVRRI